MQAPSTDRRPPGAFERFAGGTARWSGRAAAFSASVALVIGWAILGPVFHFSDTWQLVINTATTVLTVLMVFVIQNTINRDSLALHAKLDELIKSTNEASNAVIHAEQLSEDSIESILRHERDPANE
jgi:low affinity Fe/Cu permease